MRTPIVLHAHWLWISAPLIGLMLAMEFTPSDISAMAVAIGSLIAAISLAAVNIINARAAARKLEAVALEVAEVSKGNAAIQGIVDGAASRSDERERALLEKIGLLERMIAEKKETAAVLAQAVAMVPSVLPAPLEGSTPVAASLEHIDRNTEATAINTTSNTASTDATVQDLKDKAE